MDVRRKTLYQVRQNFKKTTVENSNTNLSLGFISQKVTDNKNHGIPSLRQLDAKSEAGNLIQTDIMEKLSAQKLFEGTDTDNANNIKVVIRIRPFNKRESEDHINRTCVEVLNSGTQIKLD